MTCQQQTLTLHIQVWPDYERQESYFWIPQSQCRRGDFLLSINNDQSPGSDNLDGKWLRIIADDISTPICHIFNLSLLESVCPQVWREAKFILLPKNSKAPFTGSNSRPNSLLPTLSKLLEKIVFDQIQCYFTVNKLTTDFQHAYREGHSTSMTLTQMTRWEKLMIKWLWGLSC